MLTTSFELFVLFSNMSRSRYKHAMLMSKKLFFESISVAFYFVSQFLGDYELLNKENSGIRNLFIGD